MDRARTSGLAGLFAAAAALLAACGSGAGAPTGGAGTGGGAGAGGGVITWKENGAAHAAVFPSATLTTSSLMDMLQVVGGESNTAVAMVVALRPPPLVAGSYACSDNGGQTGRIVTFGYTKGSATALADGTCSIAVTALGQATGDHAVGTFSATLTVGGAALSVTDGKFDVPLIVSSL